jgi:precorrin-3B synthase
MESGDGLVVRIRPFNGRLTSNQAQGLAELANTHGNGLMDISSRANIQLRGVTQDSYPKLINGLSDLSLLDATPQIEARRNIITTPFWQPGDATEALCTALTKALAKDTAPTLPHKFGFAVDTGPMPVLQSASADVRLERDTDGGLLICADDAPVARPISEKAAIEGVIELVHWFLKERTDETRMAKLLARTGTLPQDHIKTRQSQTYQPEPSKMVQGVLVGIAFGQVTAETLSTLANHGPLRLTPWRMLLVETTDDLTDVDGLITNPNDPLLNITACTGAPRCSQSHIETRHLAHQLVPHARANKIHVSGCTKGCAHPKPSPLTITGTPNGLSLIHQGRASDTPTQTGLSADQLIKAL